MPVIRVDGQIFANGKPGAISTELRKLYWQKREAGWLGTPVAEAIAG